MTISLNSEIYEKNIKLIAINEPHRVAKTLNIDVRRVKRWLKEDNFPNWAVELMAIKAGYLPFSGFDNWKVSNGKLYSPNLKYGFSSFEIERIHYLNQRCEYLEKMNSRPAQYYLEFE